MLRGNASAGRAHERPEDDGHEQPAQLAEAIVLAYARSLDPGQALRLERWMTCVAAAAEELGQNADPEALMALAHQLETRLT